MFEKIKNLFRSNAEKHAITESANPTAAGIAADFNYANALARELAETGFSAYGLSKSQARDNYIEANNLFTKYLSYGELDLYRSLNKGHEHQAIKQELNRSCGIISEDFLNNHGISSSAEIENLSDDKKKSLSYELFKNLIEPITDLREELELDEKYQFKPEMFEGHEFKFKGYMGYDETKKKQFSKNFRSTDKSYKLPPEVENLADMYLEIDSLHYVLSHEAMNGTLLKSQLNLVQELKEKEASQQSEQPENDKKWQENQQNKDQNNDPSINL